MVKYYSVDVVSSLVCMFKQAVDNYGKSSKTVAKYKEQIEYLTKNDEYIKRLHIQDDLDFVYRLLGMQNTDAIKWETTLSRLNMFIGAMNYMQSCRGSKDKVKCLRVLLKSQKINRTVYDYITELYDLKPIERKLRSDDTTIDDYDDSRVIPFGVLAREMGGANKYMELYGREMFESRAYGQLKYRDLVNSKQMQSLDDFTKEFLADKEQQARLSKLKKSFIKPEDVYANLSACEMLMEWFGTNNFPFIDNGRIVNKHNGSSGLKQLFRIKDNRYQANIAAGLCKYLGQGDLDAFEYYQDKKKKKYEMQLNNVYYLECVLNQVLDPSESEKARIFVVSGLLHEAKIAVPKDETCKQYYEPKTFEEMLNDLECYKQFKNCLKTPELTSKLVIQRVSDYVLNVCKLQNNDEYRKMLADKYRFTASYIIRVFDILYKHQK